MARSPAQRAVEVPAAVAAALFAIDSAAIGGAVVRLRPGPVRDAWLNGLRLLLQPGVAFRRVPLHASMERLLGGLDLAATLSTGRPVAERGILAEAHGGVLVLAGAERLEPAKAAIVAGVLDRGGLHLERDGFSLEVEAKLAVVALDEGAGEDEAIAPCLADRLAFSLHDAGSEGLLSVNWGELAEAVEDARRRLPAVTIGFEAQESLVAAASRLGIGSLRAPLLASRVARHSAALAGRMCVAAEDLEAAAAFVLAPRARQLPAPPEQEASAEPNEPSPTERDQSEGKDQTSDRELEEMVLAAVAAALPNDILGRLAREAGVRRARSAGRRGESQAGHGRGRPAGTRAGKVASGARLDVLETLRAAAPWQRIREVAGSRGGVGARVIVRGEDFRIKRMKHPTESTTIFVVDASGSQALHRLAEAKGAVELLLSQCYVRRDRVAMIAFRGEGSEVLLPPTRSLTRAKRMLAALPGGGATPLAAGLEQALGLGLAEAKRGKSTTLVLLTDGKANLDRHGNRGRERGEADALVAARCVRAAGLKCVLIDTSPQRAARSERSSQSETLAGAMGAVYLPLPRADAHALSRAVQVASGL